MVLIEQEPDAEGTRAPANASFGDAPAEGGNGGDEESFEGALTEEKLREVRSFDLLFNALLTRIQVLHCRLVLWDLSDNSLQSTFCFF